jgi:hypothetical protein
MTFHDTMTDMGSAGRREDGLTKMIESQTEAIPSVAFLGVALGAMALSWLFLATGRRNIANFIGQWVPTVLIMGLYNKTVKQRGSE